jgi:hypothetical protein
MRSLVLLLCSLAACAGHQPRPDADAPLRVQVVIDNVSSCALQLRVLEEGVTRATFRVDAYATQRSSFVPLARLNRLDFVAEPTPGCSDGRAFAVGTLSSASPRVRVNVGSHAGESSVSEIDTAPR